MILKKASFLIVILLALLSFQSCEKKAKTITKKKCSPEVKRLLDLGYKYSHNGKFDSSYYYYNKAKSAAEIKKDTSRIILSLVYMADLQRKLGDYAGSETTAIEAFPFFESTKNFPHGKRNIYVTLGTTYLYTFDNDNAIYYLNKVLYLKTDQVDKANIMNNISMAYTEKGDYHKAIQILLPLTLKNEVINDHHTFARINDNLGHAYDKAGSQKALHYLNQGLKIRKQMNDDWETFASYINLSLFYKNKNPKLATEYAKSGYILATKFNDILDRMNCLELLIQNSTGNKLKEYSLTYIRLSDSINRVRQNAKNQFAKIKYDSKKEKDENLKLKAQKVLQQEQQQNKNMLLYFIVGTIITMSILVGNFLVAKNKREKIKSSYNTEIRIAKKLHDELANDVFQTMAFAETQDLSSNQNKEILLTNLDTIYSRTRNISKENSTIETGPLFASSLKEMMSGFNNNEVNVLINGIDTINWTTIESNIKITVYRVIQELLVNMKKHSQCNLAVLTFKKNENKIEMDYSDNGIGATFDEKKSRNGLQNVENRILAIKGTVTFDTKSNKGFKVTIIFPI